MQKLKQFFKENKLGIHIHSFLKTYITVFIGTYLALNGLLDEVNIIVATQELQNLNLADINIIIISAKFAGVSVLRNIYKLLIE